MCGSLYIVMDKVLELMSKRKWQKHCLRVNVAQPEDIKITGSVKVAKIYSKVLNNREGTRALRRHQGRGTRVVGR